MREVCRGDRRPDEGGALDSYGFTAVCFDERRNSIPGPSVPADDDDNKNEFQDTFQLASHMAISPIFFLSLTLGELAKTLGNSLNYHK